jgi:hypothetical protein
VISNGRLTAKKARVRQYNNMELWYAAAYEFVLVNVSHWEIHSKKGRNAKSGVVLENYYEPRDSARFEPNLPVF